MDLLNKSNEVTINIHEICHRSAFRGVLCSTGFYLPIPVSMTEGINIPNKQQNSKSKIILWLGIRVTLRIIGSEKTLVIISNTFILQKSITFISLNA